MSKRKKSVPRVRLDVGPQLRVPKLQYTDRWYETIKNIPVPYGGKSPHKATLLAIISKSDLNRMDESTLNQLTKRADDTVKFYLNKYSKELARQPDKKERAEELLERARFYLAEARKLERSWRNGFYATGFGDTQPWPLHISWSKLHNGHCKLKGYGYKGKNVFDPSCPTKKEHEGHDADVAVLERRRRGLGRVRRGRLHLGRGRRRPWTLSCRPLRPKRRPSRRLRRRRRPSPGRASHLRPVRH